MVLWELFRLLDGLANRPFCVSKISRFQLKSNWTVCKKLLASNSKIVCKSRLILSKAQLFFCNGWFRNCIISKELINLDRVYVSCCTQRAAQTFRWRCEPIIMLIWHFESPTAVQLNSSWKTVSLWCTSCHIMQANFT